jgi:hypothetical protein
MCRTSELVQCGSFEELGEAQPFDVVVSSNVFLLMVCWGCVIDCLFVVNCRITTVICVGLKCWGIWAAIMTRQNKVKITQIAF